MILFGNITINIEMFDISSEPLFFLFFTKSQQSEVSILGPRGYGPSTLSLRHSASVERLKSAFRNVYIAQMFMFLTRLFFNTDKTQLVNHAYDKARSILYAFRGQLFNMKLRCISYQSIKNFGDTFTVCSSNCSLPS